MKNTIAIASSALIFACMVALAHADDYQRPGTADTGTPMSPDVSNQDMSQDMSKDAAKDSAQDSAKDTMKDAKKSEHWRTARMCTDESGTQFKRGEKGFRECLQQKRKMERGGQSGEMQGDTKIEEKTETQTESKHSMEDRK